MLDSLWVVGSHGRHESAQAFMVRNKLHTFRCKGERPLRMSTITPILAVVLLLGTSAERCGGAEKAPASRFQVAAGLVVEQVAGPELVKYPLFACFDDKGRLYVAEGTGTNL